MGYDLPTTLISLLKDMFPFSLALKNNINLFQFIILQENVQSDFCSRYRLKIICLPSAYPMNETVIASWLQPNNRGLYFERYQGLKNASAMGALRRYARIVISLIIFPRM